MRTAVLGATACALVAGTLALMQSASVSTPLPAAGTCGKGGAVCEKLTSVLMPKAATHPGPRIEPAAQAGGPGPVAPFSAAAPVATPTPQVAAPAAHVATPGVTHQPRVLTPAAAVPGVSAPGTVGGGVPAAAGPGAFQPGAPVGSLPAQAAGVLPQLSGVLGNAAAAYAAPTAANTAVSIVGGVVGVGSGAASALSTAATVFPYLKNAGLLPSNIGLTGISLPAAIPGISLPAGAASVHAAAIPGVPAAVPQVALPQVALPHVSLPAAAALPALPALPAALPALPAPPPLPGPPAIPHPHLCTPGFGPIGFCTP